MKKILLVILIGMTVLVLAGPTAALAQGECINGLCGTPPPPSWPGSGCPCFFCDCSLWGKTDLGETYRYSVAYDGDGIEDDFNNCAFVQNRDKVDACDSVATANEMQHTPTVETWVNCAIRITTVF